MDPYFALKLTHIVSSTLLFGTGLGTAFFMWTAHRSGDIAAIAVTARHVVLADFLFTAPAALIQPVTGFLLQQRVGYPLGLPWLAAALVLYAIAGACWLPVVWIQIRMAAMAEEAARKGTQLPALFWRYHRIWTSLGVPAFIAFIAIFYFMTVKTA